MRVVSSVSSPGSQPSGIGVPRQHAGTQSGSAPLLYLGTHMPAWLSDPDVCYPLMVSYRRLAGRLGVRAPMRAATCGWVLDSGAFSEVALHGRWTIPPERYVADVARCQREIGSLDWAAPQDRPCEPGAITRTGLSVPVHQHLTVCNYVCLRELWYRESDRPCPFIPVIQGWTPGSYEYCADLYEAAGIDLAAEPVVGVGSVCRRQGTLRAGIIMSWLASRGLRLHAFGIKTAGAAAYGSCLASFDTLAWSYAARHGKPMTGHPHRRCSSCPTYATAWRARLLTRLQASPTPRPALRRAA